MTMTIKRKENETDEEREQRELSHYSRVIKAHGEPSWAWLFTEYKTSLQVQLNSTSAFLRAIDAEMKGLDDALHRDIEKAGLGQRKPANNRRRVKLPINKGSKKVHGQT